MLVSPETPVPDASAGRPGGISGVAAEERPKAGQRSEPGEAARQHASTPERIEFVDVLRGFALFGILGLNLSLFWGNDFLTDAQRDLLPAAGVSRIVGTLLHLLVENKFLGLFAFLFGMSFSLQLDRAASRGASGVETFLRRVGWLFVIGAIHAWLFWWGDILRFYALWGFVLPLFARLRKSVVLTSALFFAVVAPALVELVRGLLFSTYSAGPIDEAAILAAFGSRSYLEMLRMNWEFDWWLTRSIGQLAYQLAIFGRLLLGLWAGRRMVLHDLERSAPLLRRVVLWGGAAALVGNAGFAGDLARLAGESAHATLLRPMVRLLNEAGFLALTLGYGSVLALLFRRPAWGRRLAVLAPVGRMALTNYLLQTLVGLWFFYGCLPGPHLIGRVGLVVIVPVWIGTYLLQVWGSTIWLRHFRFGPAEWAWRVLTHGKLQPFRLAR